MRSSPSIRRILHLVHHPEPCRVVPSGMAATYNQAEFAALSPCLGLVHKFVSREGESVRGLTVTVVGDSLLADNVMQLRAVCDDANCKHHWKRRWRG
jgi:hypothetical protein